MYLHQPAVPERKLTPAQRRAQEKQQERKERKNALKERRKKQYSRVRIPFAVLLLCVWNAGSLRSVTPPQADDKDWQPQFDKFQLQMKLLVNRLLDFS
jgi:hypothetical protein